MAKMKKKEAVVRLLELRPESTGSTMSPDVERIHCEAERILLLSAPASVRAAYEALRASLPWWH